MTDGERGRLTAKVRALMSKTVVNGCTEEEELAAARMAGRLAAQLDALPGGPESGPSWAARERQSPDYQVLLEKNMMETLLKASLQELALNHINTVSPPGRTSRGQAVEWVHTIELLEPHLVMMLGAGGSRLGRDIVVRVIEDLIADGLLPGALAIPVGE